MRVLYDYQAFEMQKFGGVSRYFCEIIEQLDHNPAATVEVAVHYSQNEYLKKTRFGVYAEVKSDGFDEFLGGLVFPGKWKLYAARNKLRKLVDTEVSNKQLAIQALQRQDFDIFHPTYYDDYFLPYLGNKPFVLTVYDMIHEIYPEYFSLADRTSESKYKLAHLAHKILAISECTKQDLVRFFGLPADKILVTHLGSSMDPAAAALDRPPALPARYVLFVGARSIYKNFYFFAQSMRPLLEKDPTLHIVCSGAPFNHNEQLFFDMHGLTGRMHHHAGSDAELQMLYQQALAFVFPSLYEGFGLPVLEAFSSACPVVLGNAGSLPEIGGDAAVYFEPKDGQSVQTAMAQALYNQPLRADLVARGQQRLAQFSWDTTCRATERVYRDLLTSSQHVPSPVGISALQNPLNAIQ